MQKENGNGFSHRKQRYKVSSWFWTSTLLCRLLFDIHLLHIIAQEYFIVYPTCSQVQMCQLLHIFQVICFQIQSPCHLEAYLLMHTLQPCIIFTCISMSVQIHTVTMHTADAHMAQINEKCSKMHKLACICNCCAFKYMEKTVTFHNYGCRCAVRYLLQHPGTGHSPFLLLRVMFLQSVK